MMPCCVLVCWRKHVILTRDNNADDNVGRFEVHMEVGLPDEGGRLQILKIHTKTVS